MPNVVKVFVVGVAVLVITVLLSRVYVVFFHSLEVDRIAVLF